MSTGLTTGPFTLTAGSSITLADPQVTGQWSTAVQIQNASGFLLSVQSDGAPYTIQPYTASTIPTPPGGAIIPVTPSALIANQVGTLTAVWLLDGQKAPIEDGSLTQTIASERTTVLSNGGSPPSYISGSSITVAAGGGLGLYYLLPLQPTDQTLTVLAYPVGGFISVLGSSMSLRVVGNISGQVYFDSSIPFQLVPSDGGTTYANITFPVLAGVDTAVLINSGGLALNNTPASLNVTILASSIPMGSPPITRPADVVTYGGLQVVNNTAILNASSSLTLQGNPPVGCLWRIHSWAMRDVFPAGFSQSVILNDTVVSNHILGQMNTQSEPGAQYLGGILLESGFGVTNRDAGHSIPANGISVWYDVVAFPYIA